MDDLIVIQKYRKLSAASLTTGILAIILCIVYFIAWAFFDDFFTSLVADFKFIQFMMIAYVCIGISFTITAVITGSIDLIRIKRGIYNCTGKGFDMTGIILGSILILFGFILWFVDFFNFINIIN